MPAVSRVESDLWCVGRMDRFTLRRRARNGHPQNDADAHVSDKRPHAVSKEDVSSGHDDFFRSAGTTPSSCTDQQVVRDYGSAQEETAKVHSSTRISGKRIKGPDRMRGAPSVGCSRGNVDRRTHAPASLPLSAPWPDFRSSEHGVGAKPSHERRGTSVARGQMPDSGCGRLSGAPGCPLRERRLSARVRRENETSFPVHSNPLDQPLHLRRKQTRSGQISKLRVRRRREASAACRRASFHLSPLPKGTSYATQPTSAALSSTSNRAGVRPLIKMQSPLRLTAKSGSRKRLNQSGRPV